MSIHLGLFAHHAFHKGVSKDQSASVSFPNVQRVRCLRSITVASLVFRVLQATILISPRIVVLYVVLDSTRRVKQINVISVQAVAQQ